MRKLEIVLLLFLQQHLWTQTGVSVPELANFDTAMTNLISQYQVPGGQLAITYHGRLVYNRGFGFADTATHALVQPNSIFRLASVSKPITSVMIMALLQNGLIHLDDTVFGPHGILNDTMYQNVMDPRVYEITVRNLLTHSGGWNRAISGDPMFDAYAIATTMGTTPPANAVTVIRYVLSHQMLDFAPGTEYQYSNLGYCILGRVIEKITRQGYAKDVIDLILQPLGITDMSTGFNLPVNQLPMEVHYYDYPGAPLTVSVYDDSTPVPWPYGGFNIEAMDSHGAWVASAQDLCRLLTAVDGFSTRPDILSASAIDSMVRPSSTNVNYACGWQVNSNNNWWHTGSLPGTTTEIVRASNQMNWAILLNTRPFHPDSLILAVDNLVWSVIPTIAEWPSNDLFTGVEDHASVPYAASLMQNYPNPFNPTTTIGYDLHVRSHVTLLVYDMLGRSVGTVVNGVEEAGTKSIAWSSGRLASGLYFYRLTVTPLNGSRTFSETRKMALIR